MSTVKQLKENTLIKRKSINKECICKASIIGLANIYGIDLKISYPSRKRDCFTLVNPLIHSIQGVSSTNSYSQLRDRSERKTFDSEMYNFLSASLINEFSLQFKECKKRLSTKTVKLIKYQCIDPFN